MDGFAIMVRLWRGGSMGGWIGAVFSGDWSAIIETLRKDSGCEANAIMDQPDCEDLTLDAKCKVPNNETCFYQIHTPDVSAVGESKVNWLC